MAAASDSFRRGSRSRAPASPTSRARVHGAGPPRPRLADWPVPRRHLGASRGAGLVDAASGPLPKTGRNVVTYLYSIFEHAIAHGWCAANPVRHASRPKRRRAGDADPDLRFLSVPASSTLSAERSPTKSSCRHAGADRSGRPGRLRRRRRTCSAGASDRDLAAAMTGLRQSELLGLRWRDVDWGAQRIRVRNAYVRGEHSGEGKSDLSTRRSVPMADRLARELDSGHSRRLPWEGDLVFAHPQYRPSARSQQADQAL